jgi:hypothetical protein
MPFALLRSPLSASRPVELEVRNWLYSGKMWSKMPRSLLHVFILVLVVAASALLPSRNSTAAQDQISSTCTSRDLPNPIASDFPNNATGVLNATLVIVPISLETARRLIPSQYGILEHAYRSLIPWLPEGKYPLLVQAAHDHDVQLKVIDFKVPDFSVRYQLAACVGYPTCKR